MPENQISHFATARRSEKSSIERQKNLLAGYYNSLGQPYEAVSEAILIVNSNRQIVFFNSIAKSLFGNENLNNIYGLRPGEALGCIYADKNPGGCGTSEFCSQCGAVNAVLIALSKKPAVRECRLLKGDNVEALDLLIRSTPLELEEDLFIIIAIIDISHEKRRRALEQIFFHDIMNTAVSINLIAQVLTSRLGDNNNVPLMQNLLSGLEQLIDELCSQRELLAAENNELVVKMQTVDANTLLEELVEVFRKRYPNHKLVIGDPDGRVILHTDRGLLLRVLGNMIINAIEASAAEQAITVSCRITEGFAEFSVHNESHIPKDCQLRLFQRSFSTKNASRGLGAYSMKLLTERYLSGSIHFSSTPQQGTTFIGRYPLEISNGEH